MLLILSVRFEVGTLVLIYFKNAEISRFFSLLYAVELKIIFVVSSHSSKFLF
jgi:hypothetical protein